MAAFSDWATLPEAIAETAARSRLLEMARKGLGISRSLPESAAIDAAIVEALATANNGPPVVADDAALAARFPLPLNDQLAMVKAAGYTKRYDQSAAAWRPEGLTYAAGPVVSIVSKGAIGNGASDGATQAINRQALRDAYASVAANGGGVVYVPKGTYDFGQDAGVESIVRVLSDHIAFIGDGFGASVLKYSSASQDWTANQFGQGGFITGGYSDNHQTFNGLIVRGLTFWDTYTTRLTEIHAFNGHGPAAIDLAAFNDVMIEQCEFKEIKGNTCIECQGSSDGTQPLHRNFTVQDCVFTGTLAGGWIEGDCCNQANLDGVKILRNRMTGMRRHGVEGGGFGFNVLIAHNKVDMQGQGNEGFGVGTYFKGLITGNRVLNLAQDQVGVVLDSDFTPLPFAVGDITISDNDFSEAAGVSARGIETENTSGVTPVAEIRILHNRFNLAEPILLIYMPQGVTHIEGNTWLRGLNNGVDFVGTTGTFANATDMLVIRNNTIAGSNRRVCDFSSAVYKDSRVRVSGNALEAVNNNASGRIDGETHVPTTIVAALPDGARSPIYTATILGAKKGDRIRIYDYFDFNPIFDGCIPFARVSANDTVKFWFLNKSGIDLNGQSISWFLRLER